MKTVAAALTIVLALTLGTAWSHPPRLISYQGLLTDVTGAPVADGTYTLTFTIYDTEDGGEALWAARYPSARVTGGLFNVVLGEGAAITLDFDVPFWLEVQAEAETSPPRGRPTAR